MIETTDWYKGDGGLTDILAFTIAEWAELQRQLQMVDTLMNAYCYTYGGLKLEVNSPHGYWPSRGLRSRRYFTCYTTTVLLDVNAWTDQKMIVWNWADKCYTSIPFLFHRPHDLETSTSLSPDQVQDFNLIKGLINKSRVMEGRKTCREFPRSD